MFFFSDDSVRIKPRISTHPRNKFVRLFDTVELSCVASGQPDPTVDWYKNGVSLNFRGNDFLIKEVTLNDRGNYSCRAKNNVGVAESNNAIVNIEGKKYICLVTHKYTTCYYLL